MRFYVLATQAEAQAVADQIDDNARAVYAAMGYTVAANGDVIGKAAGVDNPDGVTVTWDVPRQRADGKWVVLHPENHSAAFIDVTPGVSVLSFVVSGITAPIENIAPAWFPAA